MTKETARDSISRLERALEKVAQANVLLAQATRELESPVGLFPLWLSTFSLKQNAICLRKILEEKKADLNQFLDVKLADTLKIEDGEIKPKRNWRDHFDQVFGSAKPIFERADFESKFRSRGIAPTENDWLAYQEVIVESEGAA